MLVIKNVKLIIEKYQNGATKYSSFNVHSVTKSISSALTGLALQKGYLTSEHEFIMPLFSEYSDKVVDKQAKDSITVAHLLSMKSGFQGWDGPQSVDQVIVAERVSAEKTGKEFKYFTGSQMVLSAVLTKTSHSSTKDFAEQALFKPLGIKCGFWRKVDGYYAGGDETYFTARDLARFGSLYLNNGKIDGIQLIDPAWIEKSFNRYTTDSKAFRTLGCYQETGYGLSWWILNHNDKTIYTARGKGGQYVIIIPEQKVIIVVLQEWNLQKEFKIENGYLCKLLSIVNS